MELLNLINAIVLLIGVLYLIERNQKLKKQVKDLQDKLERKQKRLDSFEYTNNELSKILSNHFENVFKKNAK